MENLYNIRTALAARICVFYSRCPPDVFCVACTDPGDFLYIIVGFAPGFGFWFLVPFGIGIGIPTRFVHKTICISR